MQKVEATIKPSRLEDISKALNEIGINGMTVYEECRSKTTKELDGIHSDTMNSEDAAPNMQIDIVVEESLVDRVLSLIARHATAFPFVLLNYQGNLSGSTNGQSHEPYVITESTLPLKCPPEPAL